MPCCTPMSTGPPDQTFQNVARFFITPEFEPGNDRPNGQGQGHHGQQLGDEWRIPVGRGVYPGFNPPHHQHGQDERQGIGTVL